MIMKYFVYFYLIRLALGVSYGQIVNCELRLEELIHSAQWPIYYEGQIQVEKEYRRNVKLLASGIVSSNNRLEDFYIKRSNSIIRSKHELQRFKEQCLRDHPRKLRKDKE